MAGELEEGGARRLEGIGGEGLEGFAQPLRRDVALRPGALPRQGPRDRGPDGEAEGERQEEGSGVEVQRKRPPPDPA